MLWRQKVLLQKEQWSPQECWTSLVRINLNSATAQAEG
jgi:hypothetical protein